MRQEEFPRFCLGKKNRFTTAGLNYECYKNEHIHIDTHKI